MFEGLKRDMIIISNTVYFRTVLRAYFEEIRISFIVLTP